MRRNKYYQIEPEVPEHRCRPLIMSDTVVKAEFHLARPVEQNAKKRYTTLVHVKSQ